MDRITVDGRSFPDRIGEVAGRVWRQLRAHGAQMPRDVAHAIGRTEMEVHQAMGWLAREGKIRMESDKVCLIDREMSIHLS
jgi:hypothetical protein